MFNITISEPYSYTGIVLCKKIEYIKLRMKLWCIQSKSTWSLEATSISFIQKLKKSYVRITFCYISDFLNIETFVYLNFSNIQYFFHNKEI